VYINLEWLYTRLRAKLAVCTHIRAKLAVCIASAVSIKVCTGYRMKMSISAERSIVNTQIYNCEHSETLTGTLSVLNFGN